MVLNIITHMQRRTFINHSVRASLGLSLIPTFDHVTLPHRQERKFTLWLDPGALGVKANQQQLLDYAVEFGFESISALPNELVTFSSDQIKAFVDAMGEKNIVWASAGLTVQFREDDETFRKDLSEFPNIVYALYEAGIKRVNTWIMPRHNQLTYRQNYHQHAKRLKAVASILGDKGIRLGLEYVGPKTLWAAQKYPFVHTMEETKELIEGIGEPNVGFVLDSFHWYTAGEGAADILTLTNDDVVACDLNDARSGFTPDEQIDGKRELPAATGVIDIQSFLEGLLAIGYDGPVRAEPFNQPLRDMDDPDAVAKTHQALEKALNTID